MIKDTKDVKIDNNLTDKDLQPLSFILGEELIELLNEEIYPTKQGLFRSLDNSENVL